MPYTPEQVQEINDWYKRQAEAADRLDDEAERFLQRNAGQYKAEDGSLHCNECKQSINAHLETCETHRGFMAWFQKITEYNANLPPKPWWMCKGCDQPEESSHRFGCSIRGAKASQVILSAGRDPTGRFYIIP